MATITRYYLADFGPRYSGLATVGYTLPDGSRTTSVVSELQAGTGVYGAAITHSESLSGALTWDTGGGSPVYAFEEISPATFDLTRTLSAARAVDNVSDTALTINDALHCAVASAAGKEDVTGTAYVVKTPYTGTVIRTFTLDSATLPTART